MNKPCYRLSHSCKSSGAFANCVTRLKMALLKLLFFSIGTKCILVLSPQSYKIYRIEVGRMLRVYAGNCLRIYIENIFFLFCCGEQVPAIYPSILTTLFILRYKKYTLKYCQSSNNPHNFNAPK